MKDFAPPPPPPGAKRPRRRSDEPPAPVPLDDVPGPIRPDLAGPRPLSERQHGHRRRVTGAPAADPPPPLVVSEQTTEAIRSRQGRGKRQARVNRLRGQRRNRIRPNYARLSLRLSLALFGIVSLAALFFSPRLWVRTVRIEGLQTLSVARMQERIALRGRTNLVLLPTGRLQKHVEAEPTVAHARVRRVWPSGVLVTVEERQPVAVVQAGSTFYTIDRTLVPFRKGEAAEAGLPLLVLGPAGDGEDGEEVPGVTFGKRMIAPGLAEASKCLTWALARPTAFPLDRIVVDPLGGLCLNRKGGAEVRLGTGTDLDKKLSVLDLLIRDRADVRTGDVVYVNLFAYDAPAVLTRAAASAAASAAPREP